MEERGGGEKSNPNGVAADPRSPVLHAPAASGDAANATKPGPLEDKEVAQVLGLTTVESAGAGHGEAASPADENSDDDSLPHIKKRDDEEDSEKDTLTEAGNARDWERQIEWLTRVGGVADMQAQQRAGSDIAPPCLNIPDHVSASDSNSEDDTPTVGAMRTPSTVEHTPKSKKVEDKKWSRVCVHNKLKFQCEECCSPAPGDSRCEAERFERLRMRTPSPEEECRKWSRECELAKIANPGRKKSVLKLLEFPRVVAACFPVPTGSLTSARTGTRFPSSAAASCRAPCAPLQRLPLTEDCRASIPRPRRSLSPSTSHRQARQSDDDEEESDEDPKSDFDMSTVDIEAQLKELKAHERKQQAERKRKLTSLSADSEVGKDDMGGSSSGAAVRAAGGDAQLASTSPKVAKCPSQNSEHSKHSDEEVGGGQQSNSGLSDYEKLREKNIEQNKRLLETLGIVELRNMLPKGPDKLQDPPSPRKPKRPVTRPASGAGQFIMNTRAIKAKALARLKETEYADAVSCGWHVAGTSVLSRVSRDLKTIEAHNTDLLQSQAALDPHAKEFLQLPHDNDEEFWDWLALLASVQHRLANFAILMDEFKGHQHLQHLQARQGVSQGEWRIHFEKEEGTRLDLIQRLGLFYSNMNALYSDIILTLGLFYSYIRSLF